MSAFNPSINSIPIDTLAARVVSKGVEFQPKYKPSQQRLEAPLPLAPLPQTPEFVDLTGQRHGGLLVVGYLGTNKRARTTKWLCKCQCGYYVIRKRRALKGHQTEVCEDCDYRLHLQRKRYFEQTGVWMPRPQEIASE